MLGILFKIAAPVVLLGGLIAAFSAEQHIPKEYQRTWTLGWTAAFFAGAYFSRNWLQAVIDANWMGICGLRLHSDDALVRIRDDQFAMETEMLANGRLKKS
jgi:hypothetical protein